MYGIRKSARRSPAARTLPIVCAVIGVLAYIACSNDTTRYEPMAPQTPGASGNVVSGNVHDQGGDLVKGAVVTMEALTDGAPASVAALRNPAALVAKPATPTATSDTYRIVTETDARGRFAFSGVPAGTYALGVSADNHLGATQQVKVPGSPALLDTIVVDVNLTPTGTFSGVATLEGAATHSNIVVYAEGTSYVAVTAPDGSYAITDVPVGSYNIRATHAGYLDDTTSGVISTAGENVALAALLLKVDANFPPVASITVVTTTPAAGLPVKFVPTASDVDGTVVQYQWDFDNDGTVDWSSATPDTVSHTYLVSNVTAKLRVIDNDGGIGLAAAKISLIPLPTEIYVAVSGNDSNNGSQTAPVATLAHAYELAQAWGLTTIRMRGDFFVETPTLVPGINIEGGLDSSWLPSATPTLFAMALPAQATSISVPTVISNCLFDRITTPQTAYALIATNCSKYLEFDNCTFLAQTPTGFAPNGPNGLGGVPGFPGSAGGPGACDLAVTANGGPGGPGVCNGGAGGAGGAKGGGPGGDGTAGACGGGGGGNGGSGGDPGLPGANGANGGPGSIGIFATVGPPNGSIVGGLWVPSVDRKSVV